MDEVWRQWSTFEQVMICLSLIFTVIFIIQVSMTFLGVGGDIGEGCFEGFEAEGFGVIIEVLSFRNLTTFLACLGWTAFSLSNSGNGEAVSLIAGFVVGSVSILLNLLLLKFISTMSENGKFNIKNAIGKQGLVYTPIVNGSIGIVHVNFAGGLHELRAKSVEDLSSHTHIEVVEILSENLVLVRSI